MIPGIVILPLLAGILLISSVKVWRHALATEGPGNVAAKGG
jgi:hypothetical protein